MKILFLIQTWNKRDWHRGFNCQFGISHLRSPSNLWVEGKLTVFLLQWALPFLNFRSVPNQIRATREGGGLLSSLDILAGKNRLIKHALKPWTNMVIICHEISTQKSRQVQRPTATVGITQIPFISKSQHSLKSNTSPCLNILQLCFLIKNKNKT